MKAATRLIRNNLMQELEVGDMKALRMIAKNSGKITIRDDRSHLDLNLDSVQEAVQKENVKIAKTSYPFPSGR